MNKKLMSLAGSALLAAAVLVPLNASAADATCVDYQCEVVFSFTGSPELFTVPNGVDEIQFEVLGASGGRGGFGGQVSGTLQNLPSEFYIVVGAAGGVGSRIAGGYNGGGNAGGNRGNEGAGGGASDIRITTNLADRIIVAGGGGGAGGYSGAPGGAGGLPQAANGQSGQGSGGGGGTQTSGGFAGASNGGSQVSSEGSFGQGGTGGSSWNAGGGGGGGGWFGGGGGGADDDDCCSDGGGGGGGSSYINEYFASGIESLAGIQAGNGRITLRYEISPYLVTSTASQGLNQLANFEIVMSSPVGQVGISAFAMTGLGCQITEVRSSGSTINVEVSSCETEQVTLTLLADSIGEIVLGPSSDQFISLTLDLQGPLFTISSYSSRISQSNLAIGFSVADLANEITSSSFSVLGCDGLELFSGPDWSVELSGCQNGEAALLVPAGTFADEFGNLSPAQDLSFSFTVDQVGPVPQLDALEIEGDGPFTYSAILSFDQWATFSEEAISFLAPDECLGSVSSLGDSWLLSTFCGYGEITWLVNPEVVFDDLGNSGRSPVLSVFLSKSTPTAPEVITPAPAAQAQETPSPRPEPAPVAVEPQPEIQIELPTTESSPVDQVIVTESELVLPATFSPIAQDKPTRITKALSSKQLAPISKAVDLDTKPGPIIASEVISVSEPVAQASLNKSQFDEVADSIAGPPVAFSSGEAILWIIPALLGFVTLLALGIWRFSGK